MGIENEQQAKCSQLCSVKSSWYQAAAKQKAGQIAIIGQTFDVSLEPVSGANNDKVDDAYRAKYGICAASAQPLPC